MASRKEYEMLFQLNAQMGSSYNSTFSKAQQAITSMQKEIQSLSKTQSDIAAYQKQQSAVEATKQKLATLQQQYDNIQKEIKETEGYSSSLENKLLSKQQQIDRTSASLNQQTQKLQQMGTALNDAGVNTSNLTSESARLGAQIDDLKAKQEQAASGAGNFGKESAEAFAQVKEAIAAAGIAIALKEIYNGYMECVNAAGDFEAGMSTVEALSGASAAEMEQLSQKAKELGATTVFTAQQAADAMGYMGMAGWGAADMLSGMDGVLQLAAASGEDLAMVSDIVTDNLTAFGLKASDTARFADILAAAATNSNTNVSIMGETFKMSASIAGALGYSVEDVAVAVGLMANSGIKGSIAGTALKNTFNGLLEGVVLTSDAFGEYEYTAVRADGTMKNFGDTINELRTYFDQMTEAEKVNNAMAIAGQRGYNGLLAILNATDEDYQSLTDSINNCTGAAQRMADIKLDNMKGQLTLAKSAWDGLKIAIGEQFTPVMSDLYEIAAKVFTGITEFVQKHPNTVKAIVAITTGLAAATGVILGVAAAMKLAKVATAAWTYVLNLNPIILAATAIIGVTTAVVAFAASVDSSIPSVKELTEEAREMNNVIKDSAAAYSNTAEETMATAAVAERYIAKLEEMEAAGTDADGQSKEYQNTLALLLQTMPELSDCISVTTDKYGVATYTLDTTTEALRTNTEEWKRNALAQAYQEHISELYAQYSDVLIEAQKNEIGLTKAQQQKADAEQRYEDTVERINQLQLEAAATAERQSKEFGMTADMTAYLTQEYYDLVDSLGYINDEIWEAERLENNYQKAVDEGADAAKEAEEAIALEEAAVRELMGAEEEATGVTEEMASQAEELQSRIDDVAFAADGLVAAYNDAYDAALQSVEGQYSLWDTAAAVVATSAGTINSALESQVTYWQDYNSNLQALTDRSGDIEGLSEMIASFADGSAESVNAIAGMASASDEDLTAMVANWKTLQGEQEKVSGSIADLKTDFTNQMDELQEEFAANIKAMNLSGEASESARATIQGFIDKANFMLPQVQAAYSRLGQAALNSLNLSPSGGGGGGRTTVNAYASGTKNAERGWAMVGEDGPELMYFNGGEEVLNARETAALQAKFAAENAEITMIAPQLLQALNANFGTPEGANVGYGAGGGISLQILFQIDGSVSSETVDRLREYGDEFAERVLEVLEEAGVDIARRAYA